MIALPDDARVLICDVWGVIHDGVRAFPGALAALARWRAEGRVVVLVTNAPRPHPPLLRQLAALEVDGRHFDALVSSGDSGVAIVAARGGRAGFIGTAQDRAAILEAGVLLSDGAEPLVICTGLDEARPAPEDYADELAAMAARDAEMLCFNPDRVVYVGDTLEVCAGALADRYEALGGRVTHTGKPWPPIYVRALALAGERLGRSVDPAEVVAIGDGVRTDLLGAARMGFRFLFVASGIERDAIAEHGADRFLEAVRVEHELAGFHPLATVDGLA